MSTASDTRDSRITNANGIPRTMPKVPNIQFTEASPPNSDVLPTSSKHFRSLSKKQYFRPRGDGSIGIHAHPSPLSSSPDPRSQSPCRPKVHYSNPSNHVQITRVGPDVMPQHAGFRPVMHFNGSAGDRSDGMSEEYETETVVGWDGKDSNFSRLQPWQRSKLDKNSPFRRHSWICFDVENPARSPIDSQQSPGMILPSSNFHHHRRESFLYRSDNELDQRSPKANTRNSSIVNDSYGVEDLIVTPFAQVLASLRRVRLDFLDLTGLNASNNNSGKLAPGSKDFMTKASNTLEELDWCLKQLDTVQTHRSVSEMASNKFKKMLNKELNQLSGLSKSGNQVSEYISSTYLDNQNDVLSPNVDQNDDKDKRPSSPNTNISLKTNSKFLGMKREFRPVSEITGIHSPNRNKDVVLKWKSTPTYGVMINNEAALAAELEHIDSWGGVDLFKVAQISNGRPLTCVMYTICQKRDMFNKFNLQPAKFLTYIMTLEDHYRDVPYHNSIHAADVAQSVHSLFCLPALDGLFGDLEVLSALIASAMHDVDHPGMTNQYHCNNYTELAMIYNDQSVLEMHHVAVGFKLMLQDHCDVFEPLTWKKWQLFRKMIIDMVLATDMSKHMQLVANLKTMVETKKVASSGILELDQYNDRIEVLKNLVHCADLSNPIKPLELYKQWTERITNEYWLQGDTEREIGAEVSPMCDRDKASIEKSQVMFIDFVVYPLVEIWADLVSPDGQDMLNAITSNREYYAGLMPGSPSPIGDDRNDSSSSSTELDDDDDLVETPSEKNRFHYHAAVRYRSRHIHPGTNGSGDS